ncbi:MAG: Unknown protein [uncultured Sulfurovum sp.]|uniref:Lcl C-terminal domain-containing protein n=1 Tax=uncultured Sulfurovum sp. TaxID=269237 RepID=A0A6S6S1W8_9BACT|nr:MAG: Unknown protein [uncultured Sulfurovum sp.]
MKTILIMILACGSYLNADFSRDDANNIVSDTTTTLQWQDDNSNETETKTWQEALDYCENLTFGGSSDWRVANINELNTLIDRTKKKIAIDEKFEHVGANTVYWTSSTSIDDHKTKSWVIDFTNGIVDGKLKVEKAYVRCVKDN